MSIAARSLHPTISSFPSSFQRRDGIVNTSPASLPKKWLALALHPHRGFLPELRTNGIRGHVTKIRRLEHRLRHVQHDWPTRRTPNSDPRCFRQIASDRGRGRRTSVDIFDSPPASQSCNCRPPRKIYSSSFAIASTWPPAVAITAIAVGIGRKELLELAGHTGTVAAWLAMLREKFVSGGVVR